MVLGLMPATGLPLPFVSYGGSQIVGSFIALGLLLNIRIRKFTV
jgi:rod shape determining protein RodA